MLRQFEPNAPSQMRSLISRGNETSTLQHLPSRFGPEYNLHILNSLAKHVAPALGRRPHTKGLCNGIDVAVGLQQISTFYHYP